jgi:peptidoglycan/xylan/chitin deacetylase (PgdA/CDA1 family)
MYFSGTHKLILGCVAAASVIVITAGTLTSRHLGLSSEKATVSASQQRADVTPPPPERHINASSAPPTTARPEECPGKPAALGTSRTIFVDPQEHRRIGTMNYPETLPLRDKEVVLTFDDGPEHPKTDKVLDILASECVRATFFAVGRMVKIHPELLRRAVDEGHTVGTHTMNHPLRFRTLSAERARQEIDGGIEAASAALGGPERLAPFFRFPGFGRTEAAEEYLESRGLMVWSADFPADDWRKISPEEVARRAMRRLEENGKGVLLLHDIHDRTVEALPIIFEALKANGYHVVHVAAASHDHPATTTAADQWRLHRAGKPASSASLDHPNSN